MRSVLLALTVLTLATVPLASREANASATVVGVDLTFFHDRLTPYGDWVDLEPQGWVWVPHHVATGWRPYLAGHWVFTDCDWTWVSDDPWGWATDHYGRWLYDANWGWVWVPGDVWGPAWVAWRWGDGYVGWAPLPPGVEVTSGPIDVDLDPFAFSFVDERFLLEPVLATHIVPVARNVTIVRLTANATSYVFANQHFINRGVDFRLIARAQGRPIPRLRIQDVTTPEAMRAQVLAHNAIAVFRPRLQPPPGSTVPASHLIPASVARPISESRTQMQLRHDEERRTLWAEQTQERDRLRAMHEQEVTNPPHGISHDDLVQRHNAEERAQVEHERRNQQLMDARQQRERQTAEERQGASAEHRGRR